MNKRDTSWGKVAGWYDEHLSKPQGTYHTEVILPNLLRVLSPKKGERILDLACGQGFFSREIARSGAEVVAADISHELISLARQSSPKHISFFVAPADNLAFLTNASVDAIVIVLALQNIENMPGVFKECLRVLRPSGRLVVVLNHPTFRIPRATSWEFDEAHNVQFRRVDAYMSERRERIEMNPGEKTSKKFTISFHRPLQVYFKALRKNNLTVTRLEEWVSHKESKPGPRMVAENVARQEIPLFMMIEAKISPRG